MARRAVTPTLTELLDQIGDKASRATPGPWRVYEYRLRDNDYGVMRDGGSWGDGGLAGVFNEQNAAHIASADPQVVEALLLVAQAAITGGTRPVVDALDNLEAVMRGKP